jgi:hypothetical protein
MSQKRGIEESIFVPQITPGQYYDMRRTSSELDPIKRLMMAVLVDAVRCFQNVDMAKTRCERELSHEAEQWLFDDKREGLFSFEYVSETLGIHPQRLRSGLKQWHQQRRARELAYRLGRRSPVQRGRCAEPLPQST